MTRKQHSDQLAELAALRVTEARFRALAETAVDAIISADSAGNISFWNAAAARIFGYPEAAALGQPLTLLMPDRYRVLHLQGFARYLQSGIAQLIGRTVEIEGRHRDGHEIPLEISLSTWPGPDGPGFNAIMRDISERKHFEQTLQQKNLELENANLAKDRFLANMSHELRTPLNAIIGFTGTLLMKLAGPLSADQEKQLSTVETSARHLLSLINDLLDLARIESGKVNVTLEAISCAAVVEEVVSALRPLAEAKGLAFELALPATDISVRSDRRALAQIIINLTNNAIKYTERGAVIIALAQRQHQAQRFAEISISDTGCGIKPEDQARLFQAFTQLESASGRRGEGAGLGLHLSQKLADLIGGRITCHSEYAKGSIFTLSIPD